MQLTHYQGKMTVSDCAIGARSMTVDEACTGVSSSSTIGNAVSQLRALSALCNAAELDAASADLPLAQRKIFGDSTDQAVLRFAEQLESGTVAYLRACWKKTFELAFNSKNKFMIRCFENTRSEPFSQSLSVGHKGSFSNKDT